MHAKGNALEPSSQAKAGLERRLFVALNRIRTDRRCRKKRRAAANHLLFEPIDALEARW